MRTIPVDFVNQFVAHYREPVMRRLALDPGLRVRSIASTASLEGGIPSANLTAAGIETVQTPPCRLLLGRLAWHPGVVANAVRSPAEVVVYTGDVAFASTWVAALITRLRRRRALMWTHGWTHLDHGPRRALRLAFYSLSHGLLVYGQDAVTFGRANGFRGRIDVVGNSMSEHLGRARPAARDSAGQRWLVMSRLISSRRIDAVIRQTCRLREEGKRVRLDVVGDGPEKEALVRLAGELDAPVRFHAGTYGPEATAAFLEDADVLLSPGHVGLAAVHAMSHGCPVGTHDRADRQMPEHAVVVDGTTGVRFPFGDFDAMADRTWAFVETTDPEQVADACLQQVASLWTPRAHAERIGNAIRVQARRVAQPEVEDRRRASQAVTSMIQRVRAMASRRRRRVGVRLWP